MVANKRLGTTAFEYYEVNLVTVDIVAPLSITNALFPYIRERNRVDLLVCK